MKTTNDTTITISKRFIPEQFIVQDLPSMKVIHIETPVAELGLKSVEPLPAFDLVYSPVFEKMPIEAVYTYDKPVIIKAYPDDHFITDYGHEFMAVVTIMYIVLYASTWSKFIKEVRSCFA
jgi:hypothetical protein